MSSPNPLWQKQLFMPIGLFFVLGIFIAFLTVPARVFAQKAPSPFDKNGFQIVDELTDVADRGDNNFEYKVWLEPRLIYKGSDGYSYKRPVGWNLFNEVSQSKLIKQKNAGYKYLSPGEKSESIEVTAGNLEYEKKKISVLPQVGIYKQVQEGAETITTYSGIYPNITARFRDLRRYRQRNLVLNVPPKNLTTGERLVFWEHYKLPANSDVSYGDGKKLTNGEVEILSKSIKIILSDKSTVGIGDAWVFDSSQNGEEHLFEKVKEPLQKYLFNPWSQ